MELEAEMELTQQVICANIYSLQYTIDSRRGSVCPLTLKRRIATCRELSFLSFRGACIAVPLSTFQPTQLRDMHSLNSAPDKSALCNSN